jgi:glyoxylase-like metal-dependent hydrolase (beta-lactamase superfamily II)
MSIIPPALRFPFAAPPEDGEMFEVAEGIMWLRMALPFQLNHVNLYLIEDDGGWALIDTGIGNSRTRAVWEGLLAGKLGGRRLTRLIVTHFHPDHAGLAGWIAERCGLELWMAQAEYLTALNLRHNPAALDSPAHRAFYASNGMAKAAVDVLVTRGLGYLRMTTDLPPSYRRLQAGDVLRIGGREFDVLTGGGHAPEQVMLHCAAEHLFFPADQVLARISPNISVTGWEPHGNPLGDYLTSLTALRAQVPDDVLVLPMHNMPFHGLHQRAGELIAHHRQRCEDIQAACTVAPLTAMDVLPVVFPRALDEHQVGFAFGEVLAHVNLMLRLGSLVSEIGTDGLVRLRAG